jgi:hypothetical protein
MATGAGRGARAWFRGGDRSSVAQSIASRRRGSRGCEAPAPLVPAPRSHRERQLGCSARARTGRLRYQAHRGWLAGDTRAAGACSGRRGGARWTAFTLYGLLARDQPLGTAGQGGRYRARLTARPLRGRLGSSAGPMVRLVAHSVRPEPAYPQRYSARRSGGTQASTS